MNSEHRSRNKEPGSFYFVCVVVSSSCVCLNYFKKYVLASRKRRWKPSVVGWNYIWCWNSSNPPGKPPALFLALLQRADDGHNCWKLLINTWQDKILHSECLYNKTWIKGKRRQKTPENLPSLKEPCKHFWRNRRQQRSEVLQQQDLKTPWQFPLKKRIDIICIFIMFNLGGK